MIMKNKFFDKVGIILGVIGFSIFYFLVPVIILIILCFNFCR